MENYRYEFVSDEEMKELLEMFRELYDLESGLDAWQIMFMDNISDWHGNFTQRQAETLKSIHWSVFGVYLYDD